MVHHPLQRVSVGVEPIEVWQITELDRVADRLIDCPYFYVLLGYSFHEEREQDA